MENTVRTRFAPSPTGYMHVGNLRTALYAFLIAKSYNGNFILRIEDTDRERFIEDSLQVIFDTLKSSGIVWDEGPLVGGEYGPYIQSERKDSYLGYAMKLIDEGKAYRCFCTKERLASLKEGNANAMYDSHCLHLSSEEMQNNLDEDKPFVIRQKIDKTGKTSYEDLVYGKLEFDNSELDDQVLIKTDGMPTYNFANVIDDHLMKITHIIRGNEYLVSTPKYNLLYTAFGWDIPSYIHLPLIMASPTEKLSKRTGSASFQDLEKEGFLPAAIINYILLLGWSPGTNQEIFDMDDMISKFDIKGINKSPAIFDKNKLIWMNGEYIKALSIEDFYGLVKDKMEPYIKYGVDPLKLSTLIQKRVSTLSEIADMIDFIPGVPEYSKELYIHKKMKTDEFISLDSLKAIEVTLLSIDDFSNDNLYSTLTNLASEKGVKNSQILWPLRTALTGKPTSPGGATELAELFGKEETIKRIKDAIIFLS